MPVHPFADTSAHTAHPATEGSAVGRSHGVRSNRRPGRRVVVGAAAALLTVAIGGCATTNDAGSGAVTAAPQTSADTASDAGFPVTVETPSGVVTVEKKPSRIVSLSPSATETLFAIGAGPQVSAVDKFSTYPTEAPTTTLSGFEPNIEAIIATKPDLLVIANDTGGLVDAMKRVNVPVIISDAPTTIDGGYAGMDVLGRATGNVEKATQEVARIKSEVAEAMAKAPTSVNPPIRVYHEVDPSLVGASSNGFVGSVYTSMGAMNIADAADTAKTGYPKLTEEAIVAADPQLIVITDMTGVTAADIAKRPGWANISAVKNKHIVTVNADIASRWGPRMPQFVTQVAEALSSVANSTVSTSPASVPAPAKSAA
ncbi:MAG: helical backbone metal receptor [Dermatophilus congolensis]|nr:helical backbone metal receptor [Dermatophilus congolensis]